MPIQNILTIAGSDSGGGAGIQADLKTFSALGCYGLSVITALTAQNTRGVQAVEAVSADFVSAQLHSVASDIRIDAVKLGMLANAQIVRAVATALKSYRFPVVVLDTVMVAKGGHRLLAADAAQAICSELLPLASIITPNLPEAAALLNCDVAHTEAQMCEQGQALCAAGAVWVLMKGGHLQDCADSPDWLIGSNTQLRISRPRLATGNTHGTGCTLSAALAALYPQYGNWPDAAQAARDYLQGALANADRLQVGRGIGPVQHFHRWW
jgi:hydroxymethylpyrimidine/phosphomethylpyrimidine kinase